MKQTIHGIMLCLAAMVAIPANAQSEKTIKIENVTVINDGEGRALFRDAKDETPLNGLHRIIDGFHSAYILAEFTDGFYDGSVEVYENSKLATKGTYKEGREHGVVTAYYPDGKVSAEISFAEGKLDGLSKSYSTDGTLEEEQNFAGGLPDGLLRSYNLDGSLESEQSFKAGKEHGPERKFRNGEEKPYIDRNWFEGQPDGRQYTETTSNTGGYIEVKYFDKGVPTGEFLQTWVDGGEVKQRGSYKNGKKEGVWTEVRFDGTTESENTWRGGKLNGPSKMFFSDGSIQTITMYADDKRHGVEQTFHFGNGRISMEFNYVNDRQDGVYKRYYNDEKSTMSEEGRISRGSVVYRKIYYSNGRVDTVQESATPGGTLKITESYDEEGNKLDPVSY